MDRLLILACLSLMGYGLLAQSSRDSLFVIWQDTSQPDSVRAVAFQDYIYDYYFNEFPDSAIILAQALYKFCEEKDYKLGMVDALNLTGYTLFRIGNYSEALKNYEQGLEIAEEIGDKRGTADILMRTGFIYHDNENVIAALKYYERSLRLFEEIGDSLGIGSVYNEFGSIYLMEGDYEKSLDYYQKSIDINNSLGTEESNAAMYLNTGQLYLDQDDYSKAMDRFQKGLDIYEAKGDKLGIASGLSGIGNTFADQGDYEQALDFLLQSLSFSRQVDDVQGSTSTLLSLGIIYNKQGLPLKSIEHCKEALILAKGLGDLGGQMDAYDCLYKGYKALGRIDMALENHELWSEMVDSLQSEKTATSIQQMEFSKQLLADSLAQVEREMQINLAHQVEVQKKDRNRNLAVAAGLFFLLLALGFFSRWRYVRKSNAIIKKERDRSESLLLNILPAEIARELKEKGEAAAQDYELVSILFTDFKSFTEKSAELSASELIAEVDLCFKSFDLICEKYGIEKIKTIGDAYMAAGGLPVTSDRSVQNTVLAALEMQKFVIDHIEDKKAKGEVVFEMRLGIHTGPVVAGIVGVKKFQYDVWGDTVNTASRMEVNGEVGKVNISQQTYEFIKDDPQFIFEARGKIDVKGKGKIQMWFVSHKSGN